MFMMIARLINCGKAGGFRVGTWNVDSLAGRASELVEALAERKIDVVCVQ